MIDFNLNFLNTSSKIEERKRFNRVSISTFLIIFVFSVYIVGHIYFTQYYMVDTHRTRLSSLSLKLSSIEPRVKYLENKIGERSMLNNRLGEFVQVENRPKAWVPKIMEIANLLPGDVILTGIKYNKPKNTLKEPALILTGEHILKKSEQDYNFIDDMINTWSTSRGLPRAFKTIKVLENDIIKVDKDIKITFSIGFFTS